MSEADIYKKREPMPYGSRGSKPSKRRRRRSTPSKAFDDHSRKRRSKNSGLRRLLHLYRKKGNEKVFWWSALGTILVVLGILAIWQFGIREYMLQKQEQEDDYLQHQQNVLPQNESSVPE